MSVVLRDLDLDLEAGEVVAVTGSNGSGKSTLLRTLATLVRPAAGALEILGVRWPGEPPGDVRRRIALVGHRTPLHPDLTLRENLELVRRLQDGSGPGGLRSVPEVLDDVGLDEAADRPVRACSAGMVRRADLARVRLAPVELLLLDEPHAALDRAARGLVDAVVGTVRSSGGVVVLATHDPDLCAEVATRVLHVARGRVAEVAA